jgi:SAM-dependent methyltransferase
MYDYFLGGKTNFPADREAAEAVIAAYPAMRTAAVANRAWLARAVRFAAGEGLRQFLDIGTGIPTMGNTNEVAHAVAPDAKVVYVDNDPIVLTHARALLAGMEPGDRTSVLQADLREPDAILGNASELLDLGRPVALMLVAILHFLDDADDPAGIVRKLLDALAPGSLLILSHATGDFTDARAITASRAVYQNSTAPFRARGREEVLRFFDGTELVEPGLVQLPWWRPDGPLGPEAASVSSYAGIGRKP